MRDTIAQIAALFSEVDKRNLLLPLNAQPLFFAIYARDKPNSHEFRLSNGKIAFSVRARDEDVGQSHLALKIGSENVN